MSWGWEVSSYSLSKKELPQASLKGCKEPKGFFFVVPLALTPREQVLVDSKVPGEEADVQRDGGSEESGHQ